MAAPSQSLLASPPRRYNKKDSIRQVRPRKAHQYLLNRYQYFSSIDPTPQSEKLGKYLFMTHDKFEAAKTWISNDLPQIWAELDHYFLDELPPSVQCPV
jgi:hypothetical protein